ncbi:MerR family transcriptional regulator [Bordetella pertussis]|nr:MerR family transcriptional regulator [Bordetella pertussis]CFT91722.1 MerR family transcriptional regulator [Bordetella pertussis]CPL76314.1 MerR family transcriptional regulator [Bordetella pertussis]CPN20236.1 MerR family transcriptional regulator [Bordetella pertussis]
MLHGRFHISVQGLKTWELVAGDSISFDSRLLHSWSAAGDEPTVLLWVNTPRSF